LFKDKIIDSAHSLRHKAFLLAFTFFVSIFTIVNQITFAQTSPPDVAQPGVVETVDPSVLAPVTPTEPPTPPESQSVDPNQSPTETQTNSPKDLEPEDLGDGDTEGSIAQPNLGGTTNTVIYLPGIQVKKRPFLVKFFDSGTNADGLGIPDGDAITVNLNGKLIASDMLLVRGPEARNSPPFAA
jgi:hypothetical protein